MSSWYIQKYEKKNKILVKFDEMPEVLILNINVKIHGKLIALINMTL